MTKEKIEWLNKDKYGNFYPVGCIFVPDGWIFKNAVANIKELRQVWCKLFPDAAEVDFLTWLDANSIFKKESTE